MPKKLKWVFKASKAFLRGLSRRFEGSQPEDRHLPEDHLDRRKGWARFGFNALFSLTAAALVVYPGPLTKRIPMLSAGDIAPEDIISPLSTRLEPSSRSKLRQEELAKRVAPIFDYDDTILNVWLSNWEQTFRSIRRDFYSSKTRNKQFGADFLNDLTGKIQELTGQALPAKDILYLHQNKFSTEIETSFVKIAKRLTGRLIASTDLFPSYYSTGIVVREVNRSLHETLIQDVSRIWSIEHAREFLNHVPTISRGGQQTQVKRVVEMVNSIVVPNLKFNSSLTEKRIKAALGNVQPTAVAVRKGQKIAVKGERITEDKAELLLRLDQLSSRTAQLKQLGLTFLMFFAFFAVVFRLSLTRRGMWNLPLKDAIFFMGITLIQLLAIKLALPYLKLFFEPFQLRYGIEYLLPVASGGIIIHLMMGREAAYAFALIFSFLLGALLEEGYFLSLWSFTVTISAVRAIRSCKQRTDLYRCGLWSGSIGASMVAGYLLLQSMGLQGVDWTSFSVSVVLSFLSGLFAAIVTSSFIPVLEAALGYTTSLKLLELSNFNHPLLHALMMKAPGTYHHSVIVGSLAEIAADRIRANGLLARVAAYYHDIGKMTKPLYFIENQSPNENPHDHLSPTMSAKILFSHVKNGARMAREHNLGEAITNIIEQHHGTTLIAYFYNKAKKNEQPELDHVSEADFRYPGPRPRSREAAIVMLADACEAATRSINEPTASKIEAMVHNIINRRFLEEQFNECDLTLSDLRVIEHSFVRTLVSLYHHRIEYPGQHNRLPPGTQHTTAGVRKAK